MSIKQLIITTVLLTICIGIVATHHRPEPKPAPIPLVSKIRLLKTDVRNIAVARPSGSENNTKVRHYIEVSLTAMGLKTTQQSFSNGTNVIGIKRGLTSRTIIIGSHYDSVATTPGADDNASGCAVNLAIARALKDRKLRHTLVFVFFDAEEYGLVGSTKYAASAARNCDFMLNLDMVGTLTAIPRAAPDPVAPDLFVKYPWAKSITFQNSVGRSDHTSFQTRDVPTVWLFTGTHDRYHKASDRPVTLNYAGMKRITQYATDIVVSFDKKVDESLLRSLDVKAYTP
jgi:hypothetical protein